MSGTQRAVAVRAGRCITHYTYRGVVINRWVNDTGACIGATTIYLTAGTKYEVATTDATGRTTTDTFERLGDATDFIDRRMSGEPRFYRAPAIVYCAHNGMLAQEVAS